MTVGWFDNPTTETKVVPVSGDFAMIRDTSTGEEKKTDISNFLGGGGGWTIINVTSSTVIPSLTGNVIYMVDTTSGVVTMTLPLLSASYGFKALIYHARGVNNLIISANVTDSNKIFSDGLDNIHIPKIGNFVELLASNLASAIFWQGLNESISCQLRLHTLSGYGSSDTMISQFSGVAEDYGNLFTHNHGAYGTAGIEVTIQKSGKYGFHHVIDGSGAHNPGISLNSSQLTTASSLINPSDRLRSQIANNYDGSFAAVRLAKNDIVRGHGSGIGIGTAAKSLFIATYLGN